MLGVIVEYNPFHNGHKLHIEKSKLATNSQNCIVVMSGNFVQRGEPAIFDKYIRTKMALLNGADIVLELPIIFATASAELFALGGVDILNKTGIVNKICFGSEAGGLSHFEEISAILSNEPIQYKLLLQDYLAKGLSYPKARMFALESMLNKNLDFLKEPNNILSIEYMKAIKYLNSNIKVHTIQREQAHFHSEDLNNSIASATAIRKALLINNINNINNIMPSNCLDLINNNYYYNNLSNYNNILNYLLRITTPCQLAQIADITEGLENKILNNLDLFDTSNDISYFIEKIKSKRYTYTKLQRALLHILLNITKLEQAEYKKSLVPYIRVLGFKKSSQYVLKQLVENAKVPVILNLKNIKNNICSSGMHLLNKEITSTDIYYSGRLVQKNIEYKHPLVII